MTVLAWDGRTLAADKLMVNGDCRQHTTKIERFGLQLLGVCGNLSVGRELLAWFKAGAEPALFPAGNRNLNEGASLVVINPDGGVWKYESSPHPFEVEGDFCAFGCGDTAALVAMHCGKTAREAAIIAGTFVHGCGGGYDALDLEA